MRYLFFLFICMMLTATSMAQDSTFYQNVEWSPNGKMFCTEAIIKQGRGVRFESYIINISGATIEKTVPGTVFPSWSPDGKYIAYSKLTGIKNGSDIWMMDVKTGDTTQLTNVPSRNTGVSFAPDGKRICFSSDRDGRQNVYVMNIDGSGLQKITTDTFKYYNPVWSPAGEKIVYYRERGDGHDKVCVTDLINKQEILVTNDTMHNIYPGWNPNGKAVIYAACYAAPHDETGRLIAQINISDNSKKFFPVTANAFFARISANGKKLAFIKGGFPKTDIYIADIDGKNVQCVTCGLKRQ